MAFFLFSLQTADLHEILAINYYHLSNPFQKIYYITTNVTFSVVNCHLLSFAQKLWVEMGQDIMITIKAHVISMMS